MKILMVHNRHLIPGGEDQSFAQESQLLENHGHRVIPYVRDNSVIETLPLWQVGLRTIWSREDYREITRLITESGPDLLHVQNTFPLISPSVLYAAQRAGVPVVMSLRNYRLFCLNAYLFRAERVCEDCLQQPLPLSGIRHRCYRDSLPGSLTTATMTTLHRLLRTYQRQVNVFIALTQFSHDLFVRQGLPKAKLCIKPNFVYAPPTLDTNLVDQRDRTPYVLYIGRLSQEKGIQPLLSAWQHLGQRITLKIAGSGPLTAAVETAAQTSPGIEYLGQQPLSQIYTLLKRAQALVFPSLWYEGMPRGIIEAFAAGTPVIASKLGAMASMVTPGQTGLHIRPGDPEDLVQAVDWMLTHPQQWQRMYRQAQQQFELHYTAEQNYSQLMAIYQQAITAKQNS